MAKLLRTHSEAELNDLIHAGREVVIEIDSDNDGTYLGTDDGLSRQYHFRKADGNRVVVAAGDVGDLAQFATMPGYDFHVVADEDKDKRRR